MKVFICLLVLAASANAGILLGELAGAGGGYSIGAGHDGHHQASIIKVIHEHPHHHDVVPSAIVKVSHQHVEAAPQVVQVIHQEPAPVVHHVQLIHEHAGGYSHGSGHGGEVKIIKVIQDQGHHHHVSHGWA